MKIIFLIFCILPLHSLFAQEKTTLEKFISDSRAIVTKEREQREAQGNREIEKANTSKIEKKSGTEAFCEKNIEIDKIMKDMNKTLGYDPGFGDRLKTQELVTATCRSILESIKEEREQRENFERSRANEVYQEFQNNGNMEQEANNKRSKSIIIGIPSSIIAKATKTGKGTYNFFTFDNANHKIFILEPKTYRNNPIIQTNYKDNLPEIFNDVYSDFCVIYKNEFTKHFSKIPTTGAGDGKLSVSLKPGIYIVLAFNIEYGFIASNIAVYSDLELDYLIHIKKQAITTDEPNNQKKGSTSFEIVDENGNPIESKKN